MNLQANLGALMLLLEAMILHGLDLAFGPPILDMIAGLNIDFVE